MRQELDRRNSLCSYSRGQQCVAVCPHTGPSSACMGPHSSQGVQCYSPGHRQSRQRISHVISGVTLQCWLKDCFCVTWTSQLTAGEGSYLWAVRILGQPCLILLPPHLDWDFVLQHQPLLPVIGWQLQQQLSPSSLCHAGSILSFCTLLSSAGVSQRCLCCLRWKQDTAEGAPMSSGGKGISSWSGVSHLPAC